MLRIFFDHQPIGLMMDEQSSSTSPCQPTDEVDNPLGYPSMAKSHRPIAFGYWLHRGGKDNPNGLSFLWPENLAR